MKKVLLVLAVATVFVACDSKKKEEDKPVTPGPDTTTKVVVTPDTGNKVKPADTGKAAKPADTGKAKKPA